MSFIPNLTYSIASTVWSGTSAALGKGARGSATTTTAVTGPSGHHHHSHSYGHSHSHHHHPSPSNGPPSPGGPNSNNRRYSHNGRRYSNTYNFSRSHPNGPTSPTASSSPMTPPHSPGHYSHSASFAGPSPDRRSSRKRNPSISSIPRTPPSSPPSETASSEQHSSSHSHSHHSRKKNYSETPPTSRSSHYHTRQSSQPSSRHNGSSDTATPNKNRSSSTNSTSANSSSKGKENSPPKAPTTAEERYRIVDDILETENLYRVLAVSRTATTEEIRRAYIAKSRVCHPDKFPEYPRATEAFQKLSLAYETLSKPSSRFVYDSTGGASGRTMLGSDETLQSVLSQVFFEFMDGDFEVIRNMINTMNNTAGGVRLGDDVIGVIEEMFLRLRFVLHGCKKYMTLVHDQVQQLSEIHHSMKSLAYLDVLGRFRLTLKLSKVMLTIPMIIQDEMKREIAVAAALEGGSEQEDANAKKNAGIVGTVFLNDRVETVLKKVVSAIETGERWV
ncbi:MAG: hypothetical protein J3Q66DRAFT_346930 [Benniella sp.]|nr:MAG: hypothetical protein J3Q66DRAFT_346930 [Benniella sp.]